MKVTTVELKITDEQIKNLLCSAFEGGANYWYQIEKYQFGKTGLKYADFKQGGKMQNPENYWHPCQLVPLADGCSIVINDLEGGNRHILDRSAINTGIAAFAEKCPNHFADLLSENDDAITADCFLQCCLFGEVIYG